MQGNTSIDAVLGDHDVDKSNANVVTLDLSSIYNLKFVPIGYSNFFQHITTIWINNCPIVSLSWSDFENPSNLTRVEVKDTKITELNAEAFSSLFNVKDLVLHFNQIKIGFSLKIFVIFNILNMRNILRIYVHIYVHIKFERKFFKNWLRLSMPHSIGLR